MDRHQRVSSERLRQWKRKKRILWLRRAGLLCGAAGMVVGLLCGAVALLFSGESSVAPLVEKPIVAPTTQPTEPEQPTLVVDEDVINPGSFVDAKYAILVDVTEGRVVAEKQADVQTYPASITKMMTLLVAVENVPDLSATYEMSYAIIDPVYQQGASMAGFRSEEQVSIKDLLYGCILPSGADATAAIEQVVGGSEEGFAAMMNQRAEQLGLENTHFTNSSGLHGSNHYTSARDMALIMIEAMKNPTCREVLSRVQYTSASTPQNPDGLTWESTLFSRMYGDEPTGATVIAGKTGYTTEAGHTMASYATGDDGHDYVVVTMGGSSKWKATYDCINVLSRYVGGQTTDFYE